MRLLLLAGPGLFMVALPHAGAATGTAPIPSLQEALAKLKVPPDWMAATPVAWDTAKPWSEARLEIRRLLALDDASVRQGVKLTWLYAQKGDIGDGHELPMYLFMSGNYAWAAREYPKHLDAEAIRLYPTSDQPYGRHLLPRYVSKIQSKLDRLALQSLATTRLSDGTFTGKAMGYSDKQDLEVTLTIRGGKITDVNVKHEEKIDLNATKLVPQRIVEKQSLQVDGVTGATITSQAIV
jgi:uncharacterized protein with FMN-binding domain